MTDLDVTVVIPSFNQGQFLDATIESVFQQDLNIEVFVMDAGSSDNSLQIIEKWSPKLAGWRSHPDAGQSVAINEGIALGTAPYVAWLNSDDFWLPGKLRLLIQALESNKLAPFAYGRVNNFDDLTCKISPVWVERFDAKKLRKRCLISQPGTLIRRAIWDKLGGVNPQLKLAMDYDLWWRLFKAAGPPEFVDEMIAVNRQHFGTKTQSQRFAHYKEAMYVVKTHAGTVPLKWWLYQPYAVWFKSIVNRFQRR